MTSDTGWVPGLDNKLFLTGPPGSGKSTTMLRCIELLRGRGYTVGGISTPEIRRGGQRVGFHVLDLSTGAMAVMSGVDIISIARVGRYGVDVPGFESVALPALDHAEEGCTVVCIDEIGRMELLSAAFRRRVEELIQRPKPMIAVLHRGYVDQYGGLGRLYQVTPENRERLPQLLVSDIERGLG